MEALTDKLVKLTYTLDDKSLLILGDTLEQVLTTIGHPFQYDHVLAKHDPRWIATDVWVFLTRIDIYCEEKTISKDSVLQVKLMIYAVLTTVINCIKAN